MIEVLPMPHAALSPNVRHLLLGCAVPFTNPWDFIERLVSEAPKALTNLAAGIRDDVRDSWHSPGNIEQLKELIDILRRLYRQRPELAAAEAGLPAGSGEKDLKYNVGQHRFVGEHLVV